LKEEAFFNLLQVQENISRGQRVESFVFEIWKDGRWQKVAEGTTIGYKRIVSFNEVKAKRIRLLILSSRLQPHIGELGVFYYKGLKHESK